MSLVGRNAEEIEIPMDTIISVNGSDIVVEGPKGELHTPLMPGISLEISGRYVKVNRDCDEKQTKAWHGMTRALIANMVTGVTLAPKTLEIVGVGRRTATRGRKGKNLVMNLGYFHPVEFTSSEVLEFVVENPDKFHVRGIDKELVGQVCALIRQ